MRGQTLGVMQRQTFSVNCSYDHVLYPHTQISHPFPQQVFLILTILSFGCRFGSFTVVEDLFYLKTAYLKRDILLESLIARVTMRSILEHIHASSTAPWTQSVQLCPENWLNSSTHESLVGYIGSVFIVFGESWVYSVFWNTTNQNQEQWCFLKELEASTDPLRYERKVFLLKSDF